MSDRDTNNRFQLSLPEGWADQSIYIFDGPESNGFKHSLTLVVDNVVEEDDLDLFAQERIDAVVGATPGMEILKQERKNLPNGNEVVEAVIKWIPVDEKIIFVKKLYLMVDGIGYTFSANFTKQTIKTIGLQVDEMINSFNPAGGA